jgi:16S rRNA (adenine1518-N6/adenine1519-N6)-dimethyltransferase
VHRARKRFGQNFLHDPGVIRRILAAIAPRRDDALVEIGPGQGALTRGLLAAAGRLDAIEIDRDLIPALQALNNADATLQLHQADALSFDFTALHSGAPLRIVGNLPYNISTPLLFHLLTQAASIADLHLMLQKEVVERIVASPGSKAYGRLSVMVQSCCQAESLFRIGPGAFRPAPSVESALLRLRIPPQAPVTLVNPGHHAALVAAAFSQRRKTLRNSLKSHIEPATFPQAGIDPGARAETLSIEDFARLSNCACNRVVKP